MNGVNDGCLATGEGTTQKISASQVGVEPTTSVMPVGCSNHWATGTPGELARICFRLKIQSTGL